MNLIVRKRGSLPPGLERVEIVERKGIGHPDTICDGLAEQVCVELCRYYLDRFGLILHHNVDKVLLCGGSSHASYGGGEILNPIEIYIAGRAAQEYRGERIPVQEIAEDACRKWLDLHIPALHTEQDIRIIPRIRPGSRELTALFGKSGSIGLSNDTSCGAGFAPLSDLEKVVLDVERTLNSLQIKQDHPAIGSDIKVLGTRIDDRITLTISCAFVSRFVSDIDDYLRHKDTARRLALESARRITGRSVEVEINTADAAEAGSVFLTVTGTSAEAGDDGEAGRGNKACGLITPYRLMTMESVAGKNPVTHVGKLYNLLAGRIAGTLAGHLDGVLDAQCVLVSQIGSPVNDPYLADICLVQGSEIDGKRIKRTGEYVRAGLDAIPKLRADLLAGRLFLY